MKPEDEFGREAEAYHKYTGAEARAFFAQIKASFSLSGYFADFFGLNDDPQDTEKAAAKKARLENAQESIDAANSVLSMIVPGSSFAELMAGAQNGDAGAFWAAVPFIALDAATMGKGKIMTVLGKYPDYMNFATKLSAKRFNIPTKIWNTMSDLEQWTANVKFLDRAINRGDAIILSNKVNDINKINGAFRKELDYLVNKGYKLSNNGLQMVK